MFPLKCIDFMKALNLKVKIFLYLIGNLWKSDLSAISFLIEFTPMSLLQYKNVIGRRTTDMKINTPIYCFNSEDIRWNGLEILLCCVSYNFKIKYFSKEIFDTLKGRG